MVSRSVACENTFNERQYAKLAEKAVSGIPLQLNGDMFDITAAEDETSTRFPVAQGCAVSDGKLVRAEVVPGGQEQALPILIGSREKFFVLRRDRTFDFEEIRSLSESLRSVKYCGELTA